MSLLPFCCTNCGFWQRRFAPPATCPVCEDYRHPLPPDGYDFRTPQQIDADHRVSLREILPDVWQITTSPQLGIGPCGMLLKTDAGNLHFEGSGWVDDATLGRIADLGGVAFQAFSHGHVLGAAWRINDRFRPRTVVQAEQLTLARALDVSFPFDDRWDLTDDLELIHTAGHTPGHTVLHWRSRRLLFCGDALKFDLTEHPVGEATAVSCHKAFDAHIPLTHGDVRRYRRLLEPLDFDGVVTPWEAVATGGKAAAMRLFDAQLAGAPFADPLTLEPAHVG